MKKIKLNFGKSHIAIDRYGYIESHIMASDRNNVTSFIRGNRCKSSLMRQLTARNLQHKFEIIYNDLLKKFPTEEEIQKEKEFQVMRKIARLSYEMRKMPENISSHDFLIMGLNKSGFDFNKATKQEIISLNSKIVSRDFSNWSLDQLIASNRASDKCLKAIKILEKRYGM